MLVHSLFNQSELGEVVVTFWKNYVCKCFGICFREHFFTSLPGITLNIIASTNLILTLTYCWTLAITGGISVYWTQHLVFSLKVSGLYDYPWFIQPERRCDRFPLPILQIGSGYQSELCSGQIKRGQAKSPLSLIRNNCETGNMLITGDT